VLRKLTCSRNPNPCVVRIRRATAAAALIAALSLSLNVADAIPSEANRSTTTSKLFSGRVQLSLPKSANKPEKLSSSRYSIRPKAADKKFVIFVIQEPLRKDEVKKSNKELGKSIKDLLAAEGYEVTALTNQGSTYTVKLRAYTNVPWQKVGTTATRGTGTFQRTQDNQLIGSILLCDPNQWNDPSIGDFKKAVSSAKIRGK
jgi:hypothetical protein